MARLGTTRLSCDVDFERPGRQVSCLGLSHSDNRHAYGVVPIPIACVANGDGPTVLLCAGTHGDEHEGPIILRRLVRELDPTALRGRLIVLPTLNYPAVLADARVSPLDGGNMNRAFPGDADGSPTFAVAHFVETVLLPLCDAAVDLHSGGKASEFLPCGFLVKAGDDAFMARKVAAFKAFGAPDTVVVDATADNRSLSGAADRHGVVLVATELAGGGSVDRAALEVGRRGLRRLLAHLDVLDPDPRLPSLPAPTRFLRVRDRDDYVTAPMDGVFEPCVSLGDAVVAGQLAGWVHPVDDPQRDGAEAVFRAGGVVVCRRVPARVIRGDHLFHIGAEVGEDALTAATR